MRKRIVLIGAGSAQFGFGMLGDIMQCDALADSVIVLHDINPESMRLVEDTGNEFIRANDLPFSIEATTDRKQALRDADFIVISIEVGDRFELWEIDRTIPQQYGITQIYGENGGPGGVFHSLRIIPPIFAICEDIARICPEATTFCYSNPMTAICTAVNRKFPDLKFYGMCHEIASLERYLPDILGIDFEKLDLVAGGLNHFSVLLKASYRDTGKDAYPDILEKGARYFSELPGYSEEWAEVRENPDLIHLEGSAQKAAIRALKSSKSWADRGVFRRIMEDFDLFPITVDSHFGEYISWAHDATDHKGILDFLSLYEFMLTHVEPKIDLRLHERVVPIIEGIITDSGYTEAAVNVPNDGVFGSIPGFVAVEAPCTVDANGIHPCPMPALPPGFAALLRNYCGVYDLTADAVINKSKSAAIQAILVNPVTNKVAHVRELVDLVISKQRPWLDYLQ